MSTIAQSNARIIEPKEQVSKLTASEKAAKAKTWTVDSVEESRFALVPIIITLVACLSGFTAAFATNNYDVLRLSLVVFPTMAVLTFILAVVPMRYILFATAITVVIDTFLLLSLLF